jgi:hypothetical protein
MTWAAAEGVYLWDRDTRHNVPVTEENADAFGQILADENCRSYNARYSETVDALDYAFKLFPVLLTPSELIKACHCLDYQSCETGDWPETAAAQILRELVDAAASKIDDVRKCDVWEVRADQMAVLTNYHGPVAKKARRNA